MHRVERMTTTTNAYPGVSEQVVARVTRGRARYGIRDLTARIRSNLRVRGGEKKMRRVSLARESGRAKNAETAIIK